MGKFFEKLADYTFQKEGFNRFIVFGVGLLVGATVAMPVIWMISKTMAEHRVEGLNNEIRFLERSVAQLQTEKAELTATVSAERKNAQNTIEQLSQLQTALGLERERNEKLVFKIEQQANARKCDLFRERLALKTQELQEKETQIRWATPSVTILNGEKITQAPEPDSLYFRRLQEREIILERMASLEDRLEDCISEG